MSKLSKPEAILFDMGGVLMPSEGMWERHGFAASFPEGLPEPGLEDWFLALSDVVIAAYVALPVPRGYFDPRPIIAEHLRERGAADSQESVESWFDTLAQWEVTALYEWTAPTLHRLRDLGYRLGLISNVVMPARHQPAYFRETGIHDCFDAMLFSSEVGTSKPDPAIFRMALEQMGVAPEAAWYVGDKPHRDVRGAHAAGMTAVLVNSPYTGRIHDAPENAPDLWIDTIARLSDTLDTLEA